MNDINVVSNNVKRQYAIDNLLPKKTNLPNP